MPFPKISNLKNITNLINKNTFNPDMTNEWDFSDQLSYENYPDNLILENLPVLKLKRKNGGYYGKCDDESTKRFF